MNDEYNPFPSAELRLTDLKKLVIRRYLIALILSGLVLYLAAGTVSYWQGWLLLVVLFVPMAFFMRYMFRHDPKALERRMRTKEKEKQQRIVIVLGLIFYPLTVLIPPLGIRFGWGVVPAYVSIIAALFVFTGYMFFVWVMKENSYASRVVEIEEGQKLITTGPYKIVRHPMYLSSVIIYIFLPLTLGSYWGLLPAVGIIGVLVLRILNEERVLVQGLGGYEAYKKVTRYRLIPGIW